MMILFPLLRKFMGTIQVFYTGFAMAIIGYVVLLVLAFTNMSNVVLLFIPGFFIFGANGVLTVLTTVFLANTVDYGQLKNHRRDESVIFSMQTFVVKLASGVAALIASICLQICNLSNDTTDTAAVATAAASSVVGLRMTMTILPMICLLCGIFIFHKKYILTEEKVAEIAEQVKERGILNDKSGRTYFCAGDGIHDILFPENGDRTFGTSVLRKTLDSAGASGGV